MDILHRPIPRRTFLRSSLLAIGSLATEPVIKAFAADPGDRLGRVNVGWTELKQRPDPDSPTLGKIYEDTVVPWLREVVGRRPLRHNQRWVETPEGYIWAPYLQPVRDAPNPPVDSLPASSLGPGMWAQVSVPYVDVRLDNPPARSPWLQSVDRPRLYYSQMFWIDALKTDAQGKTWYRVIERFGFGDILWAPAEAFRPMTPAEVEPISPGVEDKRVVIDTDRQTLTCFEGRREVFFAQVSTGMKYNLEGQRVDKWETPFGIRPIWRKLISVHMTGGTTGGGYDLAGVSWTTLFEGNGVAIHSTFWHNNFGEPMSHGCINCRPEDAQWVFRWTAPVVAYDPGDVTIGMPGGTKIDVIGT